MQTGCVGTIVEEIRTRSCKGSFTRSRLLVCLREINSETRRCAQGMVLTNKLGFIVDIISRLRKNRPIKGDVPNVFLDYWQPL